MLWNPVGHMNESCLVSDWLFIRRVMRSFFIECGCLDTGA